MEPPADESAPAFLVRAPAHFRKGIFTVRLAMDVGGYRLLGQFLLDTTSPDSLASPSWLLSQGVNPAFFGKVITANNTSISGYDLPLRKFLLRDVQSYDGVLGIDFFRQFVVEFLPGLPTEIKLWPRRGFSLGRSVPWVEISEGKALFIQPHQAITLDLPHGRLWEKF